MPPAHGAAIVETILTDPKLHAAWARELEEMRLRIQDLRTSLSQALINETDDSRFESLRAHKGMFSRLPLNADQATQLIEEFAIYVPGSGRVNIAGLTLESIPSTARAIGRVIKGA